MADTTIFRTRAVGLKASGATLNSAKVAIYPGGAAMADAGSVTTSLLF